MPLYQAQISLINPATNLPIDVGLWIEAPTQAYADGVTTALDALSAYTGNVAELRAIAAQLIIDIDAQG